MTLLFQVGSAIPLAINIGVHNYWRILPGSSATRIASRSGPILEMANIVAPLVVTMAEVQDMHFRALLVVKTMLLIMVIQVTIIQSSVAKFMALLLIQNALQDIQILLAAFVDIMEVALAHTCQEQGPHATRLFITEQVIAQVVWCSVQMAFVIRNALTVTMAEKFAIKVVQQELFHVVMSSVFKVLSVPPLSQLQLSTSNQQSMPQLQLSNNSQLRR
jgi:hypothetical protein